MEHEEQKGHLWYLRYPVTGSDRCLVVATTRPETMLGDTAVAVNPADDRYRDLIGGSVRLPLLNREIPIIADDYVDMEFGTGVVKITPAHDFNDFEVGKRHNLDIINVFDESGVINAAGGQYEGMERFAARKRIIADLTAQALLEKITDHALALEGVTAARQWWSRTSPYSGTLKSSHWLNRLWPRLWGTIPGPGSILISGDEIISTGWKISRTGASPGRFGGVIAFRPGTAANAVKLP